MTTAIVSRDIPELAGSSAFEGGEAVAVRENQGRSVYRTKTAAPALAIFRGNWDPGWKARVDGKSAPVIEVNLGLKGVVVPGGNHEVEIRYLPGSFLLGAAVSVLTILALLAASLVLRFRSARPGRPGKTTA